MSNAEARRIAGIQSTVARFLNADHDLIAGATRAQVAIAVRELNDLGRTGRWQNALGNWQAMILDDTTDLRWALIQGSVGAVHAA